MKLEINPKIVVLCHQMFLLINIQSLILVDPDNYPALLAPVSSTGCLHLNYECDFDIGIALS